MNLRLRPQSVRRALRNLIDNAERYGGMVDASYGRENDHAFIRITDNGPGICQRRSKIRPLWRSKSRPVWGERLGACGPHIASPVQGALAVRPIL